jgi:hypothetical protein
MCLLTSCRSRHQAELELHKGNPSASTHAFHEVEHPALDAALIHNPIPQLALTYFTKAIPQLALTYFTKAIPQLALMYFTKAIPQLALTYFTKQSLS